MNLMKIFLILFIGLSYFIFCKVTKIRTGKKLNNRIVQLNSTKKMELNLKQPKVSLIFQIQKISN